MQGLKIDITGRQKILAFLSMITIKVLFLTKHSKNSLYQYENSPQYCYRGLLSGSVSNSVKFSSGFRCSLPGGKHLQVSTVQSIPKATALGPGEEWAWILLDALYILWWPGPLPQSDRAINPALRCSSTRLDFWRIVNTSRCQGLKSTFRNLLNPITVIQSEVQIEFTLPIHEVWLINELLNYKFHMSIYRGLL